MGERDHYPSVDNLCVETSNLAMEGSSRQTDQLDQE
jgi:hypothetical protein